MGGNSSPTRGFGFLENFLASQRYRLAKKKLKGIPEQMRILDIGCGRHPRFLGQLGFQNKYGIDKGISTETKNGIDLRDFDIGEKKNLPFTEGFFDAVTLLAVFEHLPKPALDYLIGDVFRVLKNKGLFVMTTPAGWTDGLLRFLAKIKMVSATEIDEHQDTFTPKKVVAIVGNGGFPRRNISSGLFEMGMNIWCTAKKPD